MNDTGGSRTSQELLANTLVVELPKEKLLIDLVEKPILESTLTYDFKDEHLGYYGIYELQTLEEILRKSGIY